jgi:dipeptidyl aminopeptidase/acylaminoacyl peptidase
MRVRTSVLIVSLTLLVAAPAVAQSTRFTVEDMLAVRSFAGGQPIAVSSSGRWIAYVLTDMDDEWNIQEGRPTGYVVVQTLGSQAGAPRALTAGPVHSSFPVWAPDGRRLAFIREEKGQGRVVIWDAERDQMTPVGDAFAARITQAPQWDSAGKTLILATALPETSPAPYRVRSVKSTDARIPGDQFFTNTDTARLVSIDAATGVSTVLTAQPIVLRSFQMSPTGRHVLYVAPNPETLGIIGKEQNDTFVLSVPATAGSPATARKLTERGRLSFSPDGTRLFFVRGGKLMVVPVEGGEPSPWLESLTLSVGEPVWAPDRKRFATLVADAAVTDPEIEPSTPGMYSIAQPFMDVYVVEADGRSKNVTAAFPDQVSSPVWSLDGAALYFRAVDNKSYDETIYRYTIADQRLDPVARGEESFGRLQSTASGLIAAIETATRPTDLWLLAPDGQRTRITDLNPQLARFAFSKPELFYFDNADGERLGALLYKPVGLGRNDKVPVITWIYEKMTQNRHRFNARDQMYISHGYAMLMPNVKVKVGQTADSFEKCVVPAVNAVRQMGFTNGRFGLWGHSFGAYATSNLITRTSIFAAAVSGATPPELFRNWASGRDRDSRNIETGQARMGGNPFEYPERYFSQSAFFHLDKVTTPVLILHGEKDLTILFGEGEMMFYALRRLGKTAELVAYANGDHSLSRHSRADAIDVNTRILEWFARYLQPAAAARTER